MAQPSYIARHRVTQNSYQRTMHFHDVNEILFSLNDGCSFFLNDQSYDIGRGVLILIPEGAIHRKVNPDNLIVDTYTLHYPLSFLSAYSTPNTNLSQVYAAQAACVQLPQSEIDNAIQLFERCLPLPDDAFGSDLRHDLYFLDILLKFYPLFSDGGRGRITRSNITPLVSGLIHYIDQNLARRISLDDLAARFFVSKYNLCRQFKKETGFTILEYINSSRIRKACSLLRQGDSVSSVGAQVGFPNPSHFIHVFRQHTGVTPRKYLSQFSTFTDVPFFNNFAPQDVS